MVLLCNFHYGQLIEIYLINHRKFKGAKEHSANIPNIKYVYSVYNSQCKNEYCITSIIRKNEFIIKMTYFLSISNFKNKVKAELWKILSILNMI